MFFADSVIGFSAGREIANKNLELFDAVCTELRLDRSNNTLAKLQKNLNQSISLLQRSKIKSRIQAARRMAEIYLPRGKRPRLAGITVPNLDDGDQIISEPSAIQIALKEYWGKVYSCKDMDVAAATKLMDYYVGIKKHEFQFEDFELPDAQFSTIFISSSGLCHWS